MPNRIVRDWTDSDAVNRLSADAERLFVRLIMKADDYGLFHAKPSLVKSGCFPLSGEEITTGHIASLLFKIERAGLIRIYADETSGRSFLQINKFNQRQRASKPNYPMPPWIKELSTRIGRRKGNAVAVGFIYELIDPRNGAVFYIGKTCNPANRHRTYRYGGSHGNPRLGNRLAEIKASGECVMMRIVERVKFACRSPRRLGRHELHRIYAAQRSGLPLLNIASNKIPKLADAN